MKFRIIACAVITLILLVLYAITNTGTSEQNSDLSPGTFQQP